MACIPHLRPKRSGTARPAQTPSPFNSHSGRTRWSPTRLPKPNTDRRTGERRVVPVCDPEGVATLLPNASIGQAVAVDGVGRAGAAGAVRRATHRRQRPPSHARGRPDRLDELTAAGRLEDAVSYR